ncbi:MAG: radical SAM protein [FCB group bacterium]|jgi:radical SAM protein with 4Fe4S-binding SPASM domain|nr:radical SAM protein [FCB group bacterium]
MDAEANQVKPELKILAFSITTACNMACPFCSKSAGGADTVVHLPKDTILRVTKAALPLTAKLRTLALSGGEPLLHPEFLSIVCEIRDLGVHSHVNSNGSLLTPQTCRDMFAAGVRKVTISLEGPDASIHDLVRDRHGAFERAVAGAANLLDAGIKLFFKMTLTKDNCRYLVDTLEFAAAQGAVGLGFSRMLPTGRGESERDNTIEFEELRREFQKCKKRSQEIGLPIVTDDPLRHLFDAELSERIASGELDIRGKWGGCSGGVQLINIMANGDVTPCPGLPFVVGNVHLSSFESIWTNSPRLRYFRNRDHLEPPCGTCARKFICGGCRSIALSTYGSISAPDPLCPHVANATERDPAGCPRATAKT